MSPTGAYGCGCCEDGEAAAKKISKTVREELGLTVSIGVSFNKIFAKLGSDYKKPDAITTMYADEFQTKAWNLPVGDLLYVGRSTNQKLTKIGIRTIGDLARTDEAILVRLLGKMGSVLWAFANGYDDSPVRKENTAPVAGFSISINKVYAGDDVTFVDKSSDSDPGDTIESRLWTIEKNGTVILNSDEETLSFVFDEPGNYTISLIVQDSMGTSSEPFVHNLKVLEKLEIPEIETGDTDSPPDLK